MQPADCCGSIREDPRRRFNPGLKDDADADRALSAGVFCGMLAPNEAIS